MVLSHYDIRLQQSNQISLRGKCPLPTHTSETSKESFSVHTAKNIWACQSASCAAARQEKKGGNVIDFVAIMEQSSIREAAIKMHEWFLSSAPVAISTPPTSEKGSEVTEKLVAKKNGDEGKEEEVNKPLSFTLKDIDSSHPYLIQRGIKEEVAKEFGVGFFPGRGSMSGRMVIPISNETGNLVGYAGRSINGTDPKYKLPTGFVKSAVLFNFHRVLANEQKSPVEKDFVIVVEGFFDCMKVHQAGLPCVVALMGSSISDAQQEFLCLFKRVILFLDGDDVGRAAAREIALRLMLCTFVKVINLPDGEQPDQLSSEEINSILGSL